MSRKNKLDDELSEQTFDAALADLFERDALELAELTRRQRKHPIPNVGDLGLVAKHFRKGDSTF